MEEKTELLDKMSRKKKLLYNTIASLTVQAVTMICGFILPRYFLVYFGSEVNGLVNSITEFLGFVTICECGVGAVVQSAFYGPLAQKNHYDISSIFMSSRRFFKKIAYILIAYTVVLTIAYPYIINEQFEYIYTATLIIAISVHLFVQYFFGSTYKLLLQADQLGFIPMFLQCVPLILNMIVCIILMNLGASVHLVKFFSGMIYIIEPAVLHIVVMKRYHLDTKVQYTGEPIKQKWNGFAQHISAKVLANTDVTILTLFSTLENVSVYGVYNLICNGIRKTIVALSSGLQSMLGNMIAKEERVALKHTFDTIEWAMHTLTTLLFAITGIMIVPFVSIYTKGVSDANYIVPVFGAVLVLAQGLRCIQLPYQLTIKAAGHYKQTQTSSIIEVVINIVISVLAVIKYELVGVAIGTAIAVFYRACFFAWYISKNIVEYDVKKYIEHLFVDMLSVIVMVLSTRFLMSNVSTWFGWFWLAFKVGIICLGECMVINFIFYKNNILSVYNMIKRK